MCVHHVYLFIIMYILEDERAVCSIVYDLIGIHEVNVHNC